MERIVKRRVFFCAAILFFVAAGWSTSALAGSFYVATTGTDSGACTTASSPCLTIAYAITQASSGDTIKVAKGDYTLSAALDPGAKDITFVGGYDTSDNFATTGVGVRGDRMTRLIAAFWSSIFTFATSGNASIIRNFVLQGNGGIGGGVVYSTTTVSPTIDGNTIVGWGIHGVTLPSATSPVVQNNVILEAVYGIALPDGGSAINNTVTNASSSGFNGGGTARTNNIAAYGATGFSTCGGGSGSATYSNAYNNTTNFGTDCDGGNNSTSDPLFTDSATGTSTGLDASTLTMSGASWTTDQWKGYFVTPNTTYGDPDKPQYFFILSNTGTVLTVASSRSLTSYGTSGDTYQITDFTLQSGSAAKNTGTNTGAPSTDIYGASRPQGGTTDMGATEYVEARRRPMVVQ